MSKGIWQAGEQIGLHMLAFAGLLIFISFAYDGSWDAYRIPGLNLVGSIIWILSKIMMRKQS
jgi:hypothetical protein